MKTAEEWSKEYNARYTKLDTEADEKVGDGIVPSEHIHEIIIKQIQLDAMKEGMHRAAEVATRSERGPINVTNILTAANQLTEKDII